MQRLGVEEYLKKAIGSRIVDVRSPAEYQKGHISGAINIPIFSNKERAEVGTVYKQQSREDAILLGLDIVGPKLREIANEAKKQAIDSQLFVYCWRGGMRSEKMAWLFELNGLSTYVLEGGYKNYRSFGKDKIEAIEEYIVIQGPTGSGKTGLIHALDEIGEQVVDLEGLANHKGSAFGGLGQEDQPSTQQFQNEIYKLLEGFDNSKPVWLESESAMIGRVNLPEELWRRMNGANIVAINLPPDIRIKNIIKQYGEFSKDELIEKVTHLKQKLGGKLVQDISMDIQNSDLKAAVKKLLVYYDESYLFSATQHKLNSPVSISFETLNYMDNAKRIVETFKNIEA